MTSAVIAAAGLSSRMGDFKPLMTLNGEAFIARLIRALREAEVGEIAAVVGYRADLLAPRLQALNVRVVLNENYAASQMFDSLKLGVRALTQPYDRLLLTPGDLPLLRPDTLKALMALPAELARPVYHGHGGHPLMVSARLAPSLLAYQGEGGLKGAARALHLRVTDLPVEDPGCALDADTPEDVARLRKLEEERDEQRICFHPE